MADKKDVMLAPARGVRDPLTMLRQMTSEFENFFDEPWWPSVRWPRLRARTSEAMTWSPKVDVLEKDNRLVTRVDLPGVKKEDVKVEVTDGYLALSGERRYESEEKKDDFYRSERDNGSFYRAVPLPEGVKLEDVKATFTEGVLEVSVPLPAPAAAKMRKVEIEEPAKGVKTAA